MIAVIGDIHGCFNTLTALIDNIKSRYSGIPIYSVGDLIDRGNFSFQVVDFIINNKILFTPGNHDYMFYYYFYFPKSSIGKAWLYNGCESTMESYLDHKDKIPYHLQYIKSAPLYYDLEDGFISHAGISSAYKRKLPSPPLSDKILFDEVVQNNLDSDEGILWTRDPLMNLDKLQIIGHTRQKEVSHDRKADAAYIDTSVYTGNKLSAVLVEKNNILDIISVPTVSEDIN